MTDRFSNLLQVTLSLTGCYRDAFRKIKTLWRQPDTLALWGIPYKIPFGRDPYYMYPRCAGDWVWLGCPGWFGHFDPDKIQATKDFLREVSDMVPGHPGEWADISDLPCQDDYENISGYATITFKE